MSKANSSKYDGWSKEDLIERILGLESIPSTFHSCKISPIPKPKRPAKPFDFSSYPQRKIALKFAYLGTPYNGLAYQTDHTPLPTVEGVLLSALSETRLIDPEKGFEGCGWSRCGRTDRGVSAAGQVVGLWVRSALRNIEEDGESVSVRGSATELTFRSASVVPDERPDKGTSNEDFLPAFNLDPDLEENGKERKFKPSLSPSPLTRITKSRIEFNYVDMLNRVLPPTIRIIAWSPVSPTFDARFSCSFRHYRYLFSSALPAFPGTSGSISIAPKSESGGQRSELDISAMQDAASRLVGDHDFRNLCKIDPSKQISNYTRSVTHASISRLPPPPSSNPNSLYVLDIKGNGFLYHQIRHIMAILFLVGSGFEAPSIISALLNTDPANPSKAFKGSEKDPEIVGRKPVYQMADGLPLVLWDCGYSEDVVKWRCDPFSIDDVGGEGGSESGRGRRLKRDERDVAVGSASLLHHLESTYQKMSVETALWEHFIVAAKRYQSPSLISSPDLQSTEHFKSPNSPGLAQPGSNGNCNRGNGNGVLQIPLGGGTYRRTHKYVPILERERNEHVDTVNERWRLGKGAGKVKAKGQQKGDEKDNEAIEISPKMTAIK